MEREKVFTMINDIVNVNSGKRDEYIVVEQYPEIEYTLIYRNTRFEPWVAAWCYHENEGYWGQGHYFETVNEAVSYINSVIREKSRRSDEGLIDY